MGTTRDAIQAGSTSFVWVVAFEAYKYLLTNHNDTSAVVTAWAGTDYANALPGLFVQLDVEQTIDPWEPFTGGGGRCGLMVQADPTDQFGIDTHRTAAGTETFLRSFMSRATTAIDVKRSDDFAAPTTDAFVGTECFEYSAKPNTNTLTASKRGKYSPFAAGGTGSPRFAGHHRVAAGDNGVLIEPVVSQQPRSWKGRRVGVWRHRIVNGVLDVKAQAECVFAGTVAEIRDDAVTGFTSVELEHELDRVKKFTLGRDIFAGSVASTVYIATGGVFKFFEISNGVIKTANQLTVVASGASGTNQINAGYYGLSDIATFMNSWFAGETAATRVAGTYTLNTPENTPSGNRSVMHWYNPAGAAVTVGWAIIFPNSGWGAVIGCGANWSLWGPPLQGFLGNVANVFPSSNEPKAGVGIFASALQLQNQTGVFVDNYATLPTSLTASLPAGGGGKSWGVFILNEQSLIIASVAGNFLSDVILVDEQLTVAPIIQGLDGLFPFGPPQKIRQVIIDSGSFATVIKRFVYSTGTAGYNDATYDVNAYGFGLAVPAALLGNFQSSVDLCPGANTNILVMIDKPTSFAKVFATDMTLRRCHLIWKNGGLQFTSWSSPTVSQASILLSDSSKAMPADSKGSFITSSVLDSRWVHPIVKINYNRDILTIVGNGGGNAYNSSITIEDAVSVDDMNGEGQPFTLDAMNVYGQYDQTGVGLESLAPGFRAWMPFFSRAIWKITRTIDQRYFEGYAPGDIVAVTDKHVRDPSTGIRGIVARPGLIVRHWCRYGGAQPGKPEEKAEAQGGEVDIVFLATNRVFAYAPCAQVDDTAGGSFSAGYNAGGPTLRCYANKHSEASEGVDASNFSAGDKITIVEIDPAAPASPTSWQRTILSVSSNDITLTAALSSPAWDAAKKYRVISDAYDVAVTAQQVKCYQAGTDATIKQLAPANQYGLTTSAILATSLDHTTLPEHYGTISYGPNLGKPRDTGYEKGLSLLLDNLMDHKTARQSPSMDDTVASNTTYSAGNGWQLVQMTPIFMGRMLQPGDCIRYLYVAPFFRSSDGTATQIRVSLSGYPLTDNTRNDCSIKAPATSATWSTSSTTWGIGTEQALGLSNLNGFEVGWIIVECKIKCETRGLAKCIERERINV